MKIIRNLGAFSGLVLLAGCAGLTGQNAVDQLAEIEPSGSPFSQRLTEEYREFARFEWYDMLDYADAQYFAQKGLRAAGGEIVLPEDPTTWDEPEAMIGELQAARARLMAALDATARERAPVEAAVAQARYDCWVEQQEENWQVEDIAACRNDFFAALDAIEAALAPAPAEPTPAAVLEEAVYFVFFDFDRAEITPAALDVLRTVVADAQQGQVQEIVVAGHTDTSGPADYNEELAERRAAAVEQALVQLGVPEAMITTQSFGERQLLVQTPDGVREPSNRRAEIRFD